MSLTPTQLSELQTIVESLSIEFPSSDDNLWEAAIRIQKGGLGPVTGPGGQPVFDAAVADIVLETEQIATIQGRQGGQGNSFAQATFNVVPVEDNLPPGAQGDVIYVDTIPNTYLSTDVVNLTPAGPNSVVLSEIGTQVARTVSAASGGLEVNNLATGGGFERVATVSDVSLMLPVGTNLGDLIRWDGTSAYEIAFGVRAEATGGPPGPGTGYLEFNTTGTVDVRRPQIWLPAASTQSVAFFFETAANDGFYQRTVGNASERIAWGREVASVDTDMFTIRQDGGIRVEAGADFYLTERAAAGPDVAGLGQLFVRNDTPNNLIFRDDAGNETVLNVAASAGTITGTGVVAPTAGTPYDYDAILRFENANNLETARLGWNGASILELEIFARDAQFLFNVTDTIGTTIPIMDIDPASSPIIEMIANGGEVRFGQLSGRSINISAGGAPPHTANPFIDITQAAGTYRINGATVMGIAATETQLYHSGAAVISTQAAAAGGLIVDNQSTGAGFERVLTVSDIGVQASGTPVNNQLAIWVNATTVEGDADLTWDGAELAINAGIPIIDFSGTNGLAANSIRTRAANGGLEIELLHIDGSATIWQTDAAGTTQEDAWITFARNGAVALHFDGSVALETTASGIEIQDPNGLNIEQLVMAESGGTVHAIFTASAASVLLQAAAGSGQIAMQKSTNSVTIDTTDVTLVHLGTDVARTLAAASGGLEANNTLTGAGFERVLTTSDQGAAAVQHVEQTTDTTVNNSITLVNTQLTFTDVPTGFYRIDGMFLLRDVAVSGSGARIDCSITGADSDSVARLSNKNFSGAGALSFDEQGLATDLFDAIGLVTGSGTSRFMFIGYVEFISGTNTFTVQFAQNVATVGDLDFEAGSFLSLSPIS